MRIFRETFFPDPARLIIGERIDARTECIAQTFEGLRESVARGDFSESSFSGEVAATSRKIERCAEKENGVALYSGIMYYKWRHSQGRHYQTLAPSRIPSQSPFPLPSQTHPSAPCVCPPIHFPRELSIRTAELLCRLIDSLSERCEVRYSTRYGFNFMPIISVQKRGRRGVGERASEEDRRRKGG